MDEFIEYLEAIRKEKGLNKTQFAKLIGVKLPSYSRFLNGERKVTSNFKVTVFNNLKEKQLEIAKFLK
jgi:transcriptional regulator with XRE-family HTH domain